MQKNKLNLLIYGIHLLNPYKTVVSHLKIYYCILALSSKPKIGSLSSNGGNGGNGNENVTW